MNLDQIYQIAPDLKQKTGAVKMKDFEWRFLFAFDGRKTAAAIAAEQDLDAPATMRILRKLRRNALLIDADISLHEFLSRNALPVLPAAVDVAPVAPPAASIPAAMRPDAAPTVAPISFAITRSGGIAALAPFALGHPDGIAGSRSVSVLVDLSEDRLAKDSTALSRNELAIGFSLKRSKFRLKPVIDFIVQHAGGGTVGQLAVYRVFLKIPAPLLQAAKVESLNLVTDDLEIDHPPFREAVLHSVKETLGVAFPEG